MKDANEAVVLASGFKPLYQEFYVGEDMIDSIEVTQLVYFVLAYNSAWGEFDIAEENHYGSDRLKFLSLRPRDKILVSRTQKANQAGGIDTSYVVSEFLTVQDIKRDFDSKQRS